MRKILFLLIIICIFSCKKKADEKMTVSGQVKDPFQKINIENVSVNLYTKKIESGTWNASYTLLQSGNTDENGHFSFSFDAIRASNYKINLSKAKYFDSEIEINPENVETGKDFNQDYVFYSEAYLKINIKNYYPYNDQDQISFKISKGFLNAEGCCRDTLSTYTGANVNQFKKCKVYGSQMITFEWIVTKHNTPIFHKDSILSVPFDTTNYNIFY